MKHGENWNQWSLCVSVDLDIVLDLLKSWPIDIPAHSFFVIMRKQSMEKLTVWNYNSQNLSVAILKKVTYTSSMMELA